MLEPMPDEAPRVLYFGISCENMNCPFDSRSEEPQKCCMELSTYPNATSFGALTHAVSLGVARPARPGWWLDDDSPVYWVTDD